MTPFVGNVPLLLLLLLLFICVFSNSTTTQKPPALSSSAASARRRWEIFASCSFFVHLHREVPNHARSEGSKCNPSKYNGANPHEQAPTDGSTYYPLDLAIRAARVFKNTSLSPTGFFLLLLGQPQKCGLFWPSAYLIMMKDVPIQMSSFRFVS